MRRELAIAFRARLTWLVATVAALLVGHGFVLSLDVYSAGSRSALANALSARGMDPLAGVVRPTLGGADLAISLLGPLVAARLLSVEKERNTFGALCLLEGSTSALVLEKLVAAAAVTALLLVAPLSCFIALAVEGGHLDGVETMVAIKGELMHGVLVAAVSTAAAAWTRTFAQAATLGIVVSLTSWAVDAAEGFAALAWLGGASAWSIERRLEPFQRGIVSVASIAWLGTATAAAVALALIGARFDLPRGRRVVLALSTLAASAVLLLAVGRSHRGFDWSEQRRASLPPAAVEALRSLGQPITITVYLDRDDSRRRQLEDDVLSKLLLARPDLLLRTPLDDARAVAETSHDDGYGRIVIQVGASTRETHSTSRREITTLVLEAAGRSLPDWSSPSYPGFPHVVEGGRRTALALFAYFGVPVMLLGTGYLLTRRRSVR